MSFFEAIINFLRSLFGGNNASYDAAAKVEQKTESASIQMHEDVFTVMVAGEKDKSVIESVRKEMAEKDAIGVYPYTISTDSWIYTITKPAEPYFSQYGTQYSAVQKHK